MKTDLPSLAVRRRQLQYAADAEWPYTDKANAGIRREFFLPVDCPFNVKTAQGTPPPVVT
jgi:hypothetical protein